jgi:tRNA threonylcarbamoyladenosine biosynthesis protein TsaB
MRVLALDSTTSAGSAAVVDDDRVVIERSGDSRRTHAQRLPAEILDLGIPLASVDLFAVASGPGSFTGLRIGIATIQGLAFARRKRVAAVTALDALAQLGSRGLQTAAIVGVWIDAHRHEVFTALYRVTDGALFSDSRLTEIEGPQVGPPSGTLDRWISRGVRPDLIIGDGATLYAATIGGRAAIPPPPLLAGAIGLIAVQRGQQGRTVDPAGVQPLYIRRPDAEVARDAAAFTAEGARDTRERRSRS